MSEETKEFKGVIHYRHLSGDENYFRLLINEHSKVSCYFPDELLPDVLKATEAELEESQSEVIVIGSFMNIGDEGDSQFYVQSIKHN